MLLIVSLVLGLIITGAYVLLKLRSQRQLAGSDLVLGSVGSFTLAFLLVEGFFPLIYMAVSYSLRGGTLDENLPPGASPSYVTYASLVAIAGTLLMVFQAFKDTTVKR